MPLSYLTQPISMYLLQSLSLTINSIVSMTLDRDSTFNLAAQGAKVSPATATADCVFDRICQCKLPLTPKVHAGPNSITLLCVRN
jgi:hypothetical protein